MAKISLTTVKQQLTNIVNKTASCSQIISSIGTGYVNSMQDRWNTPAAGAFADDLVGSINDYTSQFNSKYQDGLNSFVEGVNKLAASENATQVSKPTITQLKSLSRTWQPQTEDFNIPENDFQTFTNTAFSSKVKLFIEAIDAIQGYIDTAVQNGLDGKYCNQLKNSLNSLKASAANVLNQYNTAYINKAISEDSTLKTIQSAT